MEKIKVAPGIIWVSVPEVPMNILCGAPMDSVKHLMQWGLIKEIERSGILCETGPQAVLLSDLPTQRGHFWNLSEFPILHMMYKQGMSLPGHPNNTGQKPILMGLSDQLEAQSRYVFRGTYGLSSIEELMEAGYSRERAGQLWRQKLRIHFNTIKPTEELLDLVPVNSKYKEIAPGLKIKRSSVNCYKFKYNKDIISVDMNLDSHETNRPSFNLGYHKVGKQYFSVIHSGEGNGWDKDQPCMGSIICFQGRLYLIDCGPNIQASLSSLGICVNEIEGLFQTHAHDDHFAGITTLLKADRRLKFYATSAVRLSVQKKLTALLGQDESYFEKLFDINELSLGQWNDVEGLEVRPVHSPHPVETTVLFFRTAWEGNYKTYAHLADTISRRVLSGYITNKKSENGFSAAEVDHIFEEYLKPVDVKKVDVGGGLVHGDAMDFTHDESTRIILSHKSGGLTDKEKEIGSNATFGMEDVLIPAVEDYFLIKAQNYLTSYFPEAPDWSIRMLLNNPIVSLTPGTIILKKGEVSSFVYLLLSGFGEYIRVDRDISNILSTGSLIGEISGLVQKPVNGTFRAGCYSKSLKIPMEVFLHFIKINNLDKSLLKIHDIRSFIQNTELLGSMLSYPLQDKISKNVTDWSVSRGAVLDSGKEHFLYLIYDGEVECLLDDRVIQTFTSGAYFCMENILSAIIQKDSPFSYRAKRKSCIYKIPGNLLEEVPVVQSSLMENYEALLSLK